MQLEDVRAELATARVEVLRLRSMAGDMDMLRNQVLGVCYAVLRF